MSVEGLVAHEGMAMSEFNLDPALAELAADDVRMVSPTHANASQALSNHDEDEDEGMDLFGDDTGVETRERRRTPGTASNKGSEADAEGDPDGDGLTSSQRDQRKHMEYEEDEEGEPLVVQLREAAVSIPNLPIPKSSNGEHWVIRMTNFAKLDSKPFDPETYTGPEYHDDDDAESQKERSLSIKLEVENTVRWRWVKGPDGTLKRQSNSRIVRWSDGSMSLQLGKEFFDMNANVDTSASLSRTSIHASGSQQSQQSQQIANKMQQGLTYLVAQHKRAEILQAEALITGSLTLRPAGMHSETHRKLVKAVGQKHHKVARLKLSEDPSRDMEREANDRMKNAFKNKKTKKEKGETPIRRRPSGGFSRSSTKRRRGDDVYSDDDDEPEGEYTDEEGYGRSKGPGGDKKGADYQRDDFLLSDEDDIDEESGRRSKKRSKVAAEEDEAEQDSLEEMEEKMEKARAKKKATAAPKDKPQPTVEDADSDKPDDEAPEPMQLESEEEDEDAPVRTASSRKKKVMDDEDEDE